ncbi:hypothetical protein BHU72_04615 [Desulfuribacillus stibiiarsenatis]|uniref:Universal stress protein n=1 Tax=Desulfuribacillus stibiiarsenatis TaxID=1390249 RepID=A0A1E5L5I7_9FIRM|nr:universal stress protein [Desulfuribacillus stibiiarsenatis]OEH85376.1 hypothetical protein BHU72_04615 [Desulfuribacillus stibiiarsenatis]
MPYQNILLCVDSSEESNKAFNRALKVTNENGAKLTLAHVVDIPIYSDYKPYDAEILNVARTSAERLLEEFKAKAVESGITNVQVILESGSAKREIIKTIMPKVDPDLVIVGATGTNALERVLVGSVSEYIIRHSPSDVLVVR